MELKVAQVVVDARDQNGWHVIGEISDRHSSGKRPSGVIAFTEPHKAAAWKDQAPGWRAKHGICGTARFYVNEDGETVFWSGAYDLHREEAIADLVARGCRMIDSDVSILPEMVRA